MGRADEPDRSRIVTHTFKNSSHVLSAEYKDGTATHGSVVVKFKGGRQYEHSNVPKEAFLNWGTYRSPGEFYHTVITRYPIKRLDEKRKNEQ